MPRTVMAALMSLGLLAAEAPLAHAEQPPLPAPVDNRPAREEPRLPHPEPRVVVNVLSVRGPHKRSEVERSARLAWGRIVKCYKSTSKQEQGVIGIELTVASGGTVTGARRTHATLRNVELWNCLRNALQGLAMPKAEAGSTAVTEIHLAPGDPAATR